jgi:hypothetical protein
MKNIEIISKLNALEQIKDLQFGGKVSFVLAKNKKKLVEAYTLFDEVRKKLISDATDKDEVGQPIIKENVPAISEENILKLNKELDELMLQEADISLDKIEIDNFDKFEGITVNQIEAVMLFM